MDGKTLSEKLFAYAKAHLALEARDEAYTRNVLLSLCGEAAPAAEPADCSAEVQADVPDALAEELKAFAIERGMTDEEGAERFCADVFGMLTPLPSQVHRTFYEKLAQGGEAACAYFYDLCVKNGYIQKTAIGRNLRWEYGEGSGRLEITVNLSKPEKSNKDIAKLLKAPKNTGYPACMLCKENEGFEGTATHPPRRNLRTVGMTLGGEAWFMQYSPYAYYDEHCIAVNERHIPMHVDATTPDKLLDFVDILPNYFIGSNASLPIVGGSILNHEHFQGGKHRMPMQGAALAFRAEGKLAEGLEVGVLDWYNSVIRCRGKDRKKVAAFASAVIEGWKQFSCPACEILSHTGDTPHNAVSPVCRKDGDEYTMWLILRNNRTDERYPEGIFHVHPEYLHIKSEGIGLIEAMGLFILPPRLKRQLAGIEEILCGQVPYDAAALAQPEHDLHVHAAMVESLVKEGLSPDRDSARARVRDYVGKVCAGILGNTAVFKHDENGRAGFAQFLQALGLREVK